MAAPAALEEHLRRERDIPDRVRAEVLERDQGQCRSCGQAGENRLALHHVIYRSQGGAHAGENLVTLCRDCHDDVHAGLLFPEFVEWHPGQFEWFFRRLVWPRRWAGRTSDRAIAPMKVLSSS